MPSFEIILGAALRDAAEAPVRSSQDALDEMLDVVVDGERFSAATRPEQAACLLRDLVSAGTALLEGRTAKALVPLCEAPWELCLVAGSSGLSLSLYRTGPVPEVRLLDRPVAPRDLAQQAREALSTMAPRLDPAFTAELDGLVARLEDAALHPVPPPPRAPDTLLRWRSRAEGRALRVGFEAVVHGAGSADSAAVRADLHALLLRGRVSFEVRGQRAELAPGFVFLQLERLVSLCRPLLEAFGARRPMHLRVAAGSSMLGLRLGTDDALALSITRAGMATFTAPALDPRDFALPVVEAALALTQGIVRADRSRARNLRLRALRTEARALLALAKELDRSAGKLNDDPAPYRASAVPPAPRDHDPRGMDLTGSARLRYTLRWRAEIEGIDLQGTLLCGDRLVVPGARELYALDRRSGVRIWSRALPRAATALAGGGILRLSARGEVEMRDVQDGETLWSTRVAARIGGPALSFAVNVTGLPRLVVLAEGERRLVALDLRTGEPRWRYSARHAGTFRVRRIGRLLVVTCGDASVTALDVTTGEVVWRFVARGPFVMAPALHRDVVVAVAGEPGRGEGRLHAIDAFTGAQRWTANLDAAAAAAPVAAAGRAVTVCTSRSGVELVGHDLETGALRYRSPLAGRTSGGALALNAFDDLLVVNMASGRVTAADAGSGTTLWSRVLAAPVADDTPRRIDVQLRAGALFVPQSSLAVLRPRDGATLANVEACDLVPDLVRIDEECALYVAEESGHLGCYELGARLSIVRPLH